MLLLQLPRARYTLEYLKLWFKKTQMRQEYQDIFMTLFQGVWTIHTAGCLWYSASFGNNKTYVNWVRDRGIEDSPMLDKYANSLYWATVTCTTVGYGDILPTNGYELAWAMVIIVGGVAVFGYFLGNLSAQFSEVAKSASSNEEKLNEIDQLDEKFNIGFELVQ